MIYGSGYHGSLKAPLTGNAVPSASGISRQAGAKVLLQQPARSKAASSNKAARGLAAYHAGIAAEDMVAQLYVREGGAVIARRWRCREGEIDLIIREREIVVFVEVKARTRMPDHDPVSPAQWERLEAAALRYMITAETGTVPLRFDLALVIGTGFVEVTKNARL
jgi:putative endonuclease